MKTLRQTLKRNVYGIAAVMFLAAVTVPNLVIGQAHAAQVTTRSIQMSSSAQGDEGGTGVEYTMTFTTASATQIDGIVIDFCDESPLINFTCSLPSGMTVGTTLNTFEVDTVDDSGAWTAGLVNTDALGLQGTTSAISGGSQEIVISVGGFTNPSASQTFYARILTYNTNSGVTGYTSGDVDAGETHIDEGGVALSTTDNLTVSAAVLETLTFCVLSAEDSGGTPQTPEVGCTGTNAAPNLVLGSGSPPALSTSSVDEAGAYFQLSTNASGNTGVRISNGNASGGLESGSNVISPVDDTTPQAISGGTEIFGMRVGTPANATGGSGAGNVSAETEYASTTSNELNMVLDATQADNGVDSTYGSLLATATGAIDSVNVPLTFGASIDATTPAGLYTADLTLVATSSY